ncbi:sensor domain-containing diguanylate cyclase [Salidesulfovibrio brasiliensis]|uniref:sensor domain-containing diguanylate cyclase n=1 Tax=Salidesulfovibrio brasiliensis TaxID=221711 RepID=UPI0006CF2316|nr:sensor domain-containing diguanylate cyclase [Salidesulfovibrio brasiliensis]
MQSDIYREMLDQLYDGVYMVDRTGAIVYWNRAAEQITGYSSEEAVGKRCSDNLLRHVTANGQQLCLQGCPLKATLVDGKQREAAVFLHHKDGFRLPVLVRVSPLRDRFGQIEGAVEIFTDNSKRLTHEHELEQLRLLALMDELTGVGNRRAAEEALRSAHRKLAVDGIPYGVLFVDIDHFKAINDTYGHDVGDDVLRMIASTLKEGLRERDAVFRWGGEEFMLVLGGSGRDGLCTVGERIRMLAEQSWLEVGDEKVGVTVSMGGCTALAEADVETVVKCADEALYDAKQTGRNRVCVTD